MSEETGVPIPYDATGLPCGYDRADGLEDRMGTPEETGQVKATWPGAPNAGANDPAEMPIEEEQDSPVVENAEQQTITHRFHGGVNNIATEMWGLHRGIIRTDSNGFYCKLLSAVMQRQPGGHATLQTVEELMSGDTPPDLFECTPVDMGLNIIKHPRYFYAFMGEGLGSATEKANQMVIRLLQDYFENTTAAYRDALHAMFRNSLQEVVANPANYVGAGPQPPGGKYNSTTGAWDWDMWDNEGTPDFPFVSGTAMALAAALEIVTKYWRGEEVPAIPCFQITWTEFSWSPLPMNPGGYVETPIDGGLPNYFWDTNFPPADTDTWLDDGMFALLADINPQLYSDSGFAAGVTNISWRREPDVPMRDRTFWAIQHRWIGSPVGYWDPDLYNQDHRPQVWSDYHIPE